MAANAVPCPTCGGEAAAAFSPPSIDLSTGKTVKLAVSNGGAISQGVRVVGPDGEYFTGDDFVGDPETTAPEWRG